MTVSRHLAVLLVVSATLLFTTSTPAQAQTGETLWSVEGSMFSGSSIGEDYILEISGGLWNPTAAITASSEQFGILGTTIDFGEDLGLTSRQHGELRLTFKPGRRHKLRLHWLPIEYRQSSILERQIVFQGIAFDVGLPVDSMMRWDSWRFGYELDVIVRERGFVGLILEAKYTNIQAEIESSIAYEFVRARAPIPAIGAIGRFYVTRFTPVTAEFTMFQLPDNLVEDYAARYIDFDIFGTVNLNRMVGINVGYRSLDLSYLFDRDTGDLKMNGPYFSGVFRF